MFLVSGQLSMIILRLDSFRLGATCLQSRVFVEGAHTRRGKRKRGPFLWVRLKALHIPYPCSFGQNFVEWPMSLKEILGNVS